MMSTMHLTKQFEKGNTICFETVFSNLDLVKVDPVDPAYEIRTNSGVLVTNSLFVGGPYKREDGVWFFDYAMDDVGEYYVKWTGEINGNPVTIRTPFRVVESNVKY